MREIVLPEGVVPGSPEAVAYIESQVPYAGTAVDPAAPQPPGTVGDPEPAAVVAAVDGVPLDLIVAGLEMMLDGFKELRDD